MNGGSGDQRSTTTQSIPDELKPLATEYTKKAIDLGQGSFTPYTGQRFADLNPYQNAGIGMIANRALGGSQLMDSTSSALQNIINTQSFNPLSLTTQQANPSTAATAMSDIATNQNVPVNPLAGVDNPYLNRAIEASKEGAMRSMLPAFGAQQRASGSYGNAGLAGSASASTRLLELRRA